MQSFGISFSGEITGFHRSSAFGAETIALIRNNTEKKQLIVVDTGFGLPASDIFLVKDHINLTGDNPLVGENPACGPRFFKMTDLYQCTDNKFPTLVTAGLKAGAVPSIDEQTKLKELGIDCWSYNLVPTSIVAAHAGLQVTGILASQNISVQNILDFKTFLDGQN